MHRSSYDRMEEFRDKYASNYPKLADVTVLDIGSRNVDAKKELSYRDLFKDYRYTGMDIVEGENVDVVGYENIVGTFDIVISGQVMEHVKRPWEWLPQIADYVTTDGLICVIAPCSWKTHRFPIDCYRFLTDGMKALFEYAVIEALDVCIKGKDCIGIGRVLR